MTETVDETTEPAPDQTEPEPEPDDDLEPDDDDDETTEPEPEPEPEPGGLTDKELQARFDKLDRENERHAGRVGDILGEDGNQLVPCPLCSHFIAGHVYPQPVPDEIVAQVRPDLGLPDLSNVKQARHTTVCQDCEGLGVVQSGSLVRENAVIGCPTCNRSGYVLNTTGQGPTPAAHETNGSGEAPLFDGVNADDPAVAELRSRGFTVIPPLAIPAAQP